MLNICLLLYLPAVVVVAVGTALLLLLLLLLLLHGCKANNIIEKKTKHRNSRLVGDGSEDDGAALALAVMLKLALALMLAFALKHEWQRVTV